MKEFIKYTLASFLGSIFAGCVFLLLGIAATLGIIASTYSETTVQPNSVLKLDLQGTLHERVQENPLLELLGEDYQAQGLDDILHSIRSAKHNSHIRGIYLQAGTMEAPLASLEEIRDALSDFHAGDIADAIEELDMETRIRLYDILGLEQTSEIIS